MRRVVMRKISCLVAVLLVLGLCACGKKEDSMTPADATKNSAPQIEEPASDTETETNSRDITNITNTTEITDTTDVMLTNNDNTNPFLSIVKVKINPEMNIYLDSVKNIIYVECVNDDARKLAEYISEGEVLVGRPFTTGLEIILTSAIDSGYLKEKADVDISLDEISINYEADYEKVLEDVDDVVQNVMSDRHIDFNCNVTCEDYRVRDDREEPFDIMLVPGYEPNSEPDRETNREPNREPSQNGNTICKECNGTGTIVVVEERVKNVYNGTPCHICNDVGTVDDGIHGGESAECGECHGYGTSHSVGDVDDGSGGFNGDYRGYAFDEKTVKEEYSEKCQACGGQGFY